MADVLTHPEEIPAPPPPGTADTVDELLTGLPAPPRARRRVLTALLTAIPVASLFLAWQLRDDVMYAMSSSTAVSLGDGRTADPGPVGLNRLVTVQATPRMAGAVTYARVMLPGESLVFPIAGREGEPIYVQVSRDGAEAMARGEFQGRLIRFGGAGGRYAAVGNFLHRALQAPVHGSTWLLVDGDTPRAMMWAPLVASLLVAMALSDLMFLRRLLRPAED